MTIPKRYNDHGFEGCTGKYPMKDYLIKNGFIKEEDITIVSDRTRDMENINVLMCNRTGIIFLETSKINSDDYYTRKKAGSDPYAASVELSNGSDIITEGLLDSERRLKQFKEIIIGKAVCDYGTGNGLFLNIAAQEGCNVVGVELNNSHIEKLTREGYRVERSITDFEEDSFDVVTMFHVLEHLTDPINDLNETRAAIRKGGKIIIEVPHARDFLFKTLDCRDFFEFTLWSEHLILHTRESLKLLIEKAGFKNISIKGYQRYGLENHLYWLTHKKPGGHKHWRELYRDALKTEYENMLQSIDQTDTLIAVAEVG